MTDEARKARIRASVDRWNDAVAQGLDRPPKPKRKRKPKQATIPGLTSSQSPSKALVTPTEDAEQSALVKWLRASRIVFTAIPNGAYLFGGRLDRAKQWHKLQRTGCQRGFPDMLIFTPPPYNPGTRGVAVEMKRTKGGRVSEDQQAWLDQLEALGWSAIVARGVDDAVRQLREMGYGQKNLGGDCTT